jgi:preprotein translocase subunit SecA
MRLFKREMVDWAMQRNDDDTVPLENKVVTRAIASAQSQVEAQNFETRKNILKYDDVMNRQRQVVYGERRRVLEGADLHDQVREMLDDTIRGYVEGATAEGFAEDWDLDVLLAGVKTLYPTELTEEKLIEEAGGDRSGLTQEFLIETLTADAHAAYDKREESLGSDLMRELERGIVLNVLDRKWREHLYEMDYLREGISLRAMAQRDPLVEYQREGYDMFATMMESIKEESVGFIFNYEVPAEQLEGPQLEAPRTLPTVGTGPDAAANGADALVPGAPVAEVPPREQQRSALGLTGSKRPQRLSYSAPTIDGDDEVSIHADAVEEGELEYAGTPRNAPCPCGSGKKYKRCHGDPQSEHYR